MPLEQASALDRLGLTLGFCIEIAEIALVALGRGRVLENVDFPESNRAHNSVGLVTFGVGVVHFDDVVI